MTVFKTPGVYVQEISTLPPSVAEVSTAVPAFLGYTEKGGNAPLIKRVSTILEFKEIFGNAKPTEFTVTTSLDGSTQQESIKTIEPTTRSTQKHLPERLLYYAVDHYFKNGGGPCHIVSVGNHSVGPAKDDFLKGLELLRQEDEPTLIVPVDAVRLNTDDCFEVYTKALDQCKDLKDRFVIFDVPKGEDKVFRNKIGTNNLSYGAAYHPYLETSLSFAFDESGIKVARPHLFSTKFPNTGGGIKVTYKSTPPQAPAVRIRDGAQAPGFSLAPSENSLTISIGGQHTSQQIVAAWNTWRVANATKAKGFILGFFGNGAGVPSAGIVPLQPATVWTNAITEGNKGLKVVFTGTTSGTPQVTVSAAAAATTSAFTIADSGPTLTITSGTGKNAAAIVGDWINWAAGNPQSTKDFTLAFVGDGTGTVSPGAIALAKNTSAWANSGSTGLKIIVLDTASPAPAVKIESGTSVFAATKDTTPTLTISTTGGETGQALVAKWDNWVKTNSAAGFSVVIDGEGSAAVTVASDSTSLTAVEVTLNQLKTGETALYNQIKDAMSRQRVTLPPSPAIAGIYARVDRDRGVWKAPANVSVAAVIGPLTKITDAQQEDLNVDPTAGKSINAIRDFVGKGTLVWGARTLAGNDNEWRYVPVRRLFITIEESTRKASAFAVFEPNDATTWLKVKGMIDSYLYGLWERGALAGATPEAAYYVNVGLGRTMTPQDVLEGRLIIEIGVAAVRPAEFIVLRFMHKLQQA
jgi:phage tail sheath protein FI